MWFFICGKKRYIVSISHCVNFQFTAIENNKQSPCKILWNLQEDMCIVGFTFILPYL